MSDLEKHRIKVQYKRVEMAKIEMEFKVMQKLEEIERIKENIKLQDSRLEELKSQLKE